MFKFVVGLKTRRSILSLLVATIMLLSTSGISFNLHECFMSGETRLSFSVVEDCCEESGSEACCQVTIPECCEDNATENSISEQPCCEDQFVYLKLDFDFQKSNVTVYTGNLLHELTMHEGHQSEQVDHSDGMVLYLDLPPPIHGRDLIYFIQQPKVPIPA